MNIIEEETAKLLKEDFDIDAMTVALLFERGMLSHVGCRNLLIKEEYKHKIVQKERNRIKLKIAEKYCVSFISVEKILVK